MTDKAKWFASVAIGVAVAIDAAAAFADAALPRLPGPGILGLVAAGVIGAIAIARFRR